MLKDGNHKKTGKNPNDPARFIGKEAVTKEGEKADILFFLDEAKIAEEERYDGLYAVCTDLFDDDPAEILQVSDGRCTGTGLHADLWIDKADRQVA